MNGVNTAKSSNSANSLVTAPIIVLVLAVVTVSDSMENSNSIKRALGSGTTTSSGSCINFGRGFDANTKNRLTF